MRLGLEAQRSQRKIQEKSKGDNNNQGKIASQSGKYGF
jgi:hypothetical protein